MTEKKICVVTGGAGFIGSHLCDRLMESGHSVRVIDDFSNGKERNLAQWRDDERLSVLRADIADVDLIRPAFADAEWVFHLAGLADIVPSIENPHGYHHANVTGTLSVLRAASDAGVKRFVYAASSSCYGIPDIYPTPEDAEIRPQYPYALTKWVAERYVMHWEQVYGLPALALRLFNVYGPRARTSGTYGAVFGVFLAQKLSGLPLTVVGDGTQTRDFTFVSDAVDAFVLAAQSAHSGLCMNLGSDNSYPVNQLVKLLDSEYVHIPKRPGEPDCTFADTALIKEKLGWQAKVPFEEGVRIMLDNIDYWREAPVWTVDAIEKATEGWFKYLGNN